MCEVCSSVVCAVVSEPVGFLVVFMVVLGFTLGLVWLVGLVSGFKFVGDSDEATDSVLDAVFTIDLELVTAPGVVDILVFRVAVFVEACSGQRVPEHVSCGPSVCCYEALLVAGFCLWLV